MPSGCRRARSYTGGWDCTREELYTKGIYPIYRELSCVEISAWTRRRVAESTARMLVCDGPRSTSHPALGRRSVTPVPSAHGCTSTVPRPAYPRLPPLKQDHGRGESTSPASTGGPAARPDLAQALHDAVQLERSHEQRRARGDALLRGLGGGFELHPKVVRVQRAQKALRAQRLRALQRVAVWRRQGPCELNRCTHRQARTAC